MSSGFVSAGEVSVGEKKDKEIFDNRPLFERLKEAKNKVRDEQDEANKLANSLCTITDEDNEYYEELDRKVYLNNKQKKADEKDLLNKIKIMEAKSQIESEILTNIEDIDDEDGMPKISKITSTKKKSSSQAKLIENILKRKKIEESPIEFKKIKSKIVEYGSSSEDESVIMSSNSNSKNVSTHYNNVKEVGLNERDKSCIYYLRNFNNFIKSCLIQEFIGKLRNDGNYNGHILDLCCGKGGDLIKWKKSSAKIVIMTDIAEVSLEHCGKRYQEMKARENPNFPLFNIEIIHADSTITRLNDYIKCGKPFDLCNCQFSLHYAFESEQKARQMLQNATENLKEGGYFIGTIPNSNLLLSLFRNNNSINFKNKICSITYLGEEGKEQTEEERLNNIMENNIPLFGAKIDWQLDNLVNCPEYLIHVPLLKKMLEEFDMEFIYCQRFDDVIQHFIEKSPETEKILNVIKGLEKYPCRHFETQLHEECEYEAARKYMESKRSKNFFGTMSKCEWEVTSLYMAFAFRKKKISEVL